MQELNFEVRPLGKILFTKELSGEGTLVEQVHVLLRKLIINLSLPPDFPLVEQDVAKELNISKTPVREALIRLAREGLVNIKPKSGSYVTPVSLDRYLEACFIRTQLEVGCVRRLATIGLNPAGQVQLKSNLTEQAEALKKNDDVGFFEADEAFHKCLFDLAGLPGVWQMMNAAKSELDRVRHLKRKFGIRQRRLVVEEHKAIVNALIDGNPAMAEQALLENIGAVEDEITSISEHPQLLKTIQDLNELVEQDQRSRRGSRLQNGASWT